MDTTRRGKLLVVLRLCWLVIQLLFVLWLGRSGSYFYYQSF